MPNAAARSQSKSTLARTGQNWQTARSAKVHVYAKPVTGMSESSRVLSAGAGVVMVVGGLLVFGGV
jgi:hypothetical protein